MEILLFLVLVALNFLIGGLAVNGFRVTFLNMKHLPADGPWFWVCGAIASLTAAAVTSFILGPVG